MVAAINAQTSRTGITASLGSGGDQVILRNDSGNNITLGEILTEPLSDGDVWVNSYDAAGNPVGIDDLLANTGLDYEITVSGYITLDSAKSFSIASTTNQFQPGSSQLQAVSSLDVTTVNNATQALKTADAALAIINGERAKLGALQSRFEASIGHLQTTAENLTASRSRIVDADFAAETATLLRSQILQMAGTAMVAQANQLPQGVLALLR